MATHTLRQSLPTMASLCVCVFVVGSTGCHEETERRRPSLAERLPRLEVVHATRTLLPRKLELAATLDAMEKADLCARVPGVVEYLPRDVDIGRRIQGPRDGRPGEKLIHLAVPDLQAQKRHREAVADQARKQHRLAEEALAVAGRELQEAEKQENRWAAEHAFLKLQHERVQQLVARGAQQPERQQETQRQVEVALAAWEAARAQIDTRQAKVKAAEADVEVAASRVSVADADVENIVTMIGLATITAPFDGVVTRRLVDRGATIRDPGTVLLTVMRTNQVRVILDVPERDVPLINATQQNPNPDGKGDLVTLTIPALMGVVPRGEFIGHVVRLADALDPTTRTMRVEVHLDNPNSHLKPGMYGTASILLEERYDALTIPASALVRRAGKIMVYQVADVQGEPPTGMVKRIDDLELGLDDGQRVEVRRGLSDRELIIVKGNGVVRHGDRVIAVPAREH